MAQFSFKDYDLTLDFPTCTFTVRCDSDYSDKIKNMGEEFTGLSEKLIKGEITKDYSQSQSVRSEMVPDTRESVPEMQETPPCH